MDLRALLPDFARHLSARAAASRTIVSYTRTVEALLCVLGDQPPGRSAVEAFLSRPTIDGDPRAASTKRAELMALRAFFQLALREHGVADATDGIAIGRGTRVEPRVAIPADIPRLFNAAERSTERARDLAVLGLLFVLGMRVHEVAQLDAAQVDPVAHMLWRVRGKGGTVTDLPLPARLEDLLGAWLRRRLMDGHDDSGPLFPTARPSSSRTGRLSIRSLQRLVARLCVEAELGRQLGPHALRHGCATAAIVLGIDVPTVAAALRHSSIATTQGYVHLASDARRTAFERISSLIPKASTSEVLSAGEISQNPAKTGPSRGGGAAVDIQQPMGDIREPKDHGRLPRKTGTTSTPKRACFGPQSPRVELPRTEEGPRGHGRIEELLAEHLEAVRALVDASLDAFVLELRSGPRDTGARNGRLRRRFQPGERRGARSRRRARS